MTEERILSLPIHPYLDSAPSSKEFPTCCHAEMAEPLHSPSGKLHIAKYTLGDKATTATFAWQLSSVAMGNASHFAALWDWGSPHSAGSVPLGAWNSPFWNAFTFPESKDKESPLSSSELLEFVLTGNNHWDVAIFDVACRRKTAVPRQQSTFTRCQGNLQRGTTLRSLHAKGTRIGLKALQWHFTEWFLLLFLVKQNID